MATQVSQQLTHANEYGANYGMARQAIINGNFDVWQRSTSTSAPANLVFVADRWKTQTSGDGGTLPTVVHSRQAITPGDISNSFYHYRIAPNGAGTSLGVNSYGVINQTIEYGTRFLCGNGKKVTVSFYARSDIANKKLGVQLQQNYGSGGSPSAEEVIAGQTISLTTSWVKYTVTFTTNTLSGKTFGTANDDRLDLLFWVMWGSTIGAARGLTGTETYVGSGYIDIAQVQLCAGDIALPFQPKSFEEELINCMRYYEKSFPYATAPAQNSNSYYTVLGCQSVANNLELGMIPYKVRKRVATTPVIYNPFAANAYARITGTTTDFNVSPTGTENGLWLVNYSGGAGPSGNILFHWSVDAEL